MADDKQRGAQHGNRIAISQDNEGAHYLIDTFGVGSEQLAEVVEEVGGASTVGKYLACR